jgi:hypothetical protein
VSPARKDHGLVARRVAVAPSGAIDAVAHQVAPDTAVSLVAIAHLDDVDVVVVVVVVQLREVEARASLPSRILAVRYQCRAEEGDLFSLYCGGGVADVVGHVRMAGWEAAITIQATAQRDG